MEQTVLSFDQKIFDQVELRLEHPLRAKVRRRHLWSTL